MFYDAVTNDHGLKHDPFKALVVPRPIGWISSLAADGRPNLAPYSFFNAFASRPNIVGFASQGFKHSQANIEATGEFVCNLATFDLREQMNMSSAAVDAGVDEFALSGLTAVPSERIAPPRVAESPVALECVYLQSLALKDKDGQDAGSTLILGQVVGVHIDDTLISDGRVYIERARPISRLGFMDYASVDSVFAMDRPVV